MPTKITNYTDYNQYIKNHDMANLFYVYDQPDESTSMVYNINRTIQFEGLDNADAGTFDYYEVTEGDTWNLISYKKYGTTRLWWLICKANGVVNPTVEPTAGSPIQYFPKESISTILTSIKDS